MEGDAYPATRTRACATQEKPYGRIEETEIKKAKIVVVKEKDETWKLIYQLIKQQKGLQHYICNAYINLEKIPLIIIDSGSAGCIITLELLKVLEIKITQATMVKIREDL
ncbi:12527_t:CDS:2 [Funneliformis caledonium]|uniref:12527_t:CDS:1 n=1 Tax=Funneliformis caledonium TaxID=1117310 RepID=A0A9N9DAY7_9GLOM|nr:12527_t:CDS:2 [Funneliformis caledonium]